MVAHRVLGDFLANKTCYDCMTLDERVLFGLYGFAQTSEANSPNTKGHSG